MSEIETDAAAVVKPTNTGIDLTPDKDGGVIKVIKKEGSGDEHPMTGNKVTVHYTGTLLDGTKFDSSRDRDDKFTFNLGKGEVIKAWDLGVASMKRGELCELTCKAEYAYGSQGSPPKIPAHATLVFEVELFDWEAEDITDSKDKGVIRQILKEGSDYSTPNEGASVKVKVQGKYEDKVFDDRTLEYNLSEADDDLAIVPALDVAVKKMRKGEVCRIKVQSKYGYGSTGCEKFGIPPNANLVYDLELLEFEKTKEAWEMNDLEKIEQSKMVKAKGTDFFKAKAFKKAIVQYKKIESYLDYHEAKEDGSEEDKTLIQEWNELKLAAFLNLALCYGKILDYAQSESYCNKALKLDPTNEKGLFRKGEAQLNQNDFEEAKKSFGAVLKVNNDNKSARQQMQKCTLKIKEGKSKEKAKYQGMFDKFAKQDKDQEIRQKVEQKKERAKAKAEKKADGEAPPASNGNHAMEVTEEAS